MYDSVTLYFSTVRYSFLLMLNFTGKVVFETSYYLDVQNSLWCKFTFMDQFTSNIDLFHVVHFVTLT